MNEDACFPFYAQPRLGFHSQLLRVGCVSCVRASASHPVIDVDVVTCRRRSSLDTHVATEAAGQNIASENAVFLRKLRAESGSHGFNLLRFHEPLAMVGSIRSYKLDAENSELSSDLVFNPLPPPSFDHEQRMYTKARSHHLSFDILSF